VRAAFEAYLAQDLAAERALLAEHFRFTSPQDDHIDKAAFHERCFPTAARLVSQVVLDLVDAGGDGVFIRYEYELTTGERHRNTVEGPRPPHPSQARGGPRDGADA
jgi:hypothetical protein